MPVKTIKIFRDQNCIRPKFSNVRKRRQIFVLGLADPEVIVQFTKRVDVGTACQSQICEIESAHPQMEQTEKELSSYIVKFSNIETMSMCMKN